MIRIFCFFILPLLLHANDYCKGRAGSRQETFQMALEMLEEREGRILVETGTLRGGYDCTSDGCSTLIFADWARDHSATLISVDHDPKALQVARKIFAIESKAKKLSTGHVHLVGALAIPFLQNFGKAIDLLYLDTTKDPKECLKEIIAAQPWLHEKTIILINDCPNEEGKGTMALKFLEKRGWTVVKQTTQTLLTYE